MSELQRLPETELEPAEAEPLPLRLLRAGIAPLVLAAGVGGVGALELARSRFQQSRLFEPTRHPHGEWDPSVYGIEFEDIEFESADGTRLHGWWMPVRGAASTLVYCHGNSGSIGDRLPIYQRLLALLRVNLFAFDYRGYGRSEGVPTEKGVLADARAALDWVRTERRVVPESTLLLGHSLGGAVAIDTALHREVAGLIVQSSFTQLRDMARVRYPDLPLHWITRNGGFSSIDKVARLEVPKLFVHGAEDETIPFDHGVQLWHAASAPKAFLTLRRARHNDLHVRGSLLYHSALRRFHRACLGRECMDRFTASLRPPAPEAAA
ncbi:MAG: alpha/beta hydrolase [Acidobacteriota bacterium]